jgi:hypothetical protein
VTREAAVAICTTSTRRGDAPSVSTVRQPFFTESKPELTKGLTHGLRCIFLMPSPDSEADTKARTSDETDLDAGSLYPPKKLSRYLMTKRGYLHPNKTYVWITLLIVGVMSVLYFILGINPGAQGTLPPGFDAGSGGAPGVSDLYFHSIAIGMAALAVYFVVLAFDLDRYEPAIDFPLCYRALLATVFGAAGAFFYLRPIFTQELAPIPLGLLLLGLVFTADVGGALLVQMYLLPGKISGTYDPSQNRFGMIPVWRTLPSWTDFRKMDSSYWLTFIAIIGAFIAGITGFVVFWLNYFVIDLGVSPALFSGYIAWMGGAQSFWGVTLGSHSHAIVMCLILGLVGVVAKRFEVLSLPGWKRTVAKVGLWVGATGVIALTAIFFLEAYTTVFPGGNPGLFFASNPGSFTLYAGAGVDTNGMAADDTMMLWASLGALIVLLPLFFTTLKGRPAWKDPVRFSILATWILTFIATPLQGFYIEFNESSLAGNPPDLVFGNLQYFALIGIPLVCIGLLAIDFYQEKRSTRTTASIFAIFGTLIALVTGFIYVFYTTGSTSAAAWGFGLGLLLMDLFLLVAMVGVYLGNPEKVEMMPADGGSFAAPRRPGPPKAPAPERSS